MPDDPAQPTSLSLFEALVQIGQLGESLRRMAERDSEQEVLGMAIPVVDAVLEAARQHLSEGDPLLLAIHDVMSPENVADGDPVRVLEVLLVVEQLERRLDTIWQATQGPMVG